MRVLILRCGPAARAVEPPVSLADAAQILDVSAVPDRAELRDLDAVAAGVLPEDPTPSLDEIAARPDVSHLGDPGPAPQAPFVPEPLRVIVVGTDAALSAVLTRAMRSDYLWAEFAYVPLEQSPATTNWALPVGAAAWPLAVHGRVDPAPLIRSDRGLAVAGSATLTAADGEAFTGEIVVDDETIVFQADGGPALGARLVPMTGAPGVAAVPLGGTGLRARFRAALTPPRPRTGRAVQTGGRDIVVTVDSVAAKRPVTRATFYRHLRDLQIVRAS